MPFSHNRFDEYMKSLIAQTGYERWLDIGAGAGKFGKMVKGILPDAYIRGMEINQEYIEQYNLNQKYDSVLCVDAVHHVMNFPSNYEGIILGDVLEHLPKSQGTDLVNALVYCCKMMFVIYPIGRIQEGYKGFSHETHISVWNSSDWDNFEHQAVEDASSHLVVVDGYIEHERIDIRCFQSI